MLINRCAVVMGVVVGLILCTLLVAPGAAASGNVRFESEPAGGTPSSGSLGSGFGWRASPLGDINGDGTPDAAIGTSGGAWIVPLTPAGTALPRESWLLTASSLPNNTTTSGGFASALADLGDFDGNGARDMLVGVSGDDVASTSTRYDDGSVRLVLMDTDGSVADQVQIANGMAGFTGILSGDDFFGAGVAVLGDLDGDFVTDIAVGATGDDDASDGSGAVWILFLNADGTVKSHSKLSGSTPGLAGIDSRDVFGSSIANLGDVDGDGVTDIAVGAPGDDDGGSSAGAVWILLLNNDGSLKGAHKISDDDQTFAADLEAGDNFGSAVGSVGDIDGDLIPDLLAGAYRQGAGAFFIIQLASDGSVKQETRFASGENGFVGTTSPDAQLGISVAAIGDVDGDTIVDLFVGATNARIDDSRGVGWLTFLAGPTTVGGETLHSAASGGIGVFRLTGDRLAESAARIGDLDGDGRDEIAVGAPGGIDATLSEGSVWIASVDTAGDLTNQRKITARPGFSAFAGTLDSGDEFGASVTGPGDIDGDTIEDVIVGAPGDDDGGADRGALWVINLDTDGSVKGESKISATAGAFGAALPDGARLGSAAASLGDIDGDGVSDVAVSADQLWLLFLDAAGAVKSQVALPVSGSALASLGDIDGDGNEELIVGDPAASAGSGAVHVVSVNDAGATTATVTIDSTSLAFGSEPGLGFGSDVAGVGDVDGDLVPDILAAVAGSSQSWLLMLNPDGSLKQVRSILSSDVDRVWEGIDLEPDGIVELGYGRPEGSGLLGYLRVSEMCAAQPLPFCLASNKSRFSVQARPGNSDKQRIIWASNPEFTVAEAFGAPLSSSNPTEYTVCIYDQIGAVDEAASTTVLHTGRNFWNCRRGKCRYRDKDKPPSLGALKLKLRPGEDGKARVRLKMQGRHLQMPPSYGPPEQFVADPTITVQLVNTTGACWVATYTGEDIRRNDVDQFVGRNN